MRDLSALPEPRRAVINLRDARPVWAMPAWADDRIRAAFGEGWEVRFVEAGASGEGDGGGASAEALRGVAGAEVYFGYGFPPELLRAARGGGDRLRWVHSGAAGVGSALYPEMREADVVLTNSAGIHAEPMAETALAMILHFARGLDLALAAQARRDWGKAAFEAADTPVREISGATLGVVGYGGIGAALGRRAVALGMRVLGWKRTPAEAPPGVELHTGPRGLEELLAASDYLVLTVPQTEETRGLLGAEQLRRMRPEAVLVNLARGGVVDEPALVDALRGGRLRGAALDVFAREPLPESSPLWALPSVLITPHVSATSRRYWEREVALIEENVRRYRAGEPLRNLVDKAAGY